MKIRDRLSLQFTVIFALIFVLVLASIYVTTEKNRRMDFNDRLRDRALTVAQRFLAEDNLSPEKFKDVQKRYPLYLPDETVRVYDDKYSPVFIMQDSVQFPRSIIDRVVAKKELYYTKDKAQICGIYYNDNSGNFVVLISAVDNSGYKRMHDLFVNMLIIFLISVVIMFFMGRLFARSALAPISKVINDVKYIRSTSLNKRLATQSSHDEIYELVVTFNNLLEHLEQSFEAQKSFITNSSHELRTPITAIMGDLEVTLTNERTNEEYCQALQRVLAETNKLNELINNLFELAQANIDANLEDLRLDELLWQVKDEWSNNVKDSEIELVMNLAAEEKRFTIQGNRYLLFIALGNLVKNAIKFSNNRKVVCSIESKPNATVISIKDQGIGIRPDDVKKIFEPFTRGSNSSGYSGMGIGLSMAEKIIKLHNGTITVNTAYTNGAEFVVTFPNVG